MGVLLRWSIELAMGRHEIFPTATFLVNMLGCFIAGALWSSRLTDEWRVPLTIGFCGGFTTFSAYALQSLTLLERGALTPALTYLIVSPAAGLLCAWIGMAITR
jgi:CrcB protein